MTMTKDDHEWLSANAITLVGYYCTICGWKMDPRIYGSYSTMEKHILDHRDAGVLIGASAGGVIAPRGGE